MTEVWKDIEGYDGKYQVSSEGRVRAKVNRSGAKPIYQISMDGELIKKYPSTREVERQTGFKQSFVSACARGEHRAAYGFRWTYFNPTQVLEQLDALFNPEISDKDIEDGNY